jgi:hypothetical protein
VNRTQLDHLVVVADSLTQGVAWCEAALGVTPGPGGKHPLMGTHNRLFKIASAHSTKAYFEIIAVDDEAPPPGRPRWFGMDNPRLREAVRHVPRLVHFVASTPDLQKACRALAGMGEDVGTPVEASRATSQGELRWQITVRPDGVPQHGGALPTLIEWGAVHPTDSMEDSGVALEHLQVLALQAHLLRQRYDALGLAGIDVMEDGRWARPVMQVVLRTPRGTVTLTGGF